MIDFHSIIEGASLAVLVGIFYRMGMFTSSLDAAKRRLDVIESRLEKMK